MIIRITDLRKAKVCARASLWFKDHGLDWKDFVLNGIEADKLLATGDAQAKRVVEIARGQG